MKALPCLNLIWIQWKGKSEWSMRVLKPIIFLQNRVYFFLISQKNIPHNVSNLAREESMTNKCIKTFTCQSTHSSISM